MVSDFYSDIPKIAEFIGVIDENNFFPVPDDWIIVIADIRSSTDAVAQGRYKDVNMIGGAVICAVQNATGSRNLPFVFGGDGATLLIEPSDYGAVKSALVRTRSLANDDFSLDLRIGFVPVKDVVELGASVLVARYEVSPGNYFAMFGGGGAELAETLVKADNAASKYAVPKYSLSGFPDLTGLSCRWESLDPQKGRILCVLVKPLANEFHKRQAILSRFLSKLTDIIGSDLNQASPVTAKSLRFSWPPKGLAAEAKATRAKKPYWRRVLELYFETLIQWTLEQFNLSAGGYNSSVYREELRSNSDHCKFDDTLRMVLDCTLDQVVAIRTLLEQMHSGGDLEFGLFETEQAQITCLLLDLESSQHLHFVDGGNGGFYEASKELKKQSALSKPEFR